MQHLFIRSIHLLHDKIRITFIAVITDFSMYNWQYNPLFCILFLQESVNAK